MSTVERARAFAIERHGEQTRKYTGEPYWHHPRAVARLVADTGASEALVAATWLHDILEDTPTTEHELSAIFGPVVRDLVVALTERRAPGQPRSARKARDRSRLAAAPAGAHTIKLADLIDNASTIVARNPNFARTYLTECEHLHRVLTNGNPELYRRAGEVLRAARRALAGVSPESHGAR
jgi:guanosine-3',5'-bis(diphosphate) 3'-pyrophosphohydrolase